MSRSEPPSSSSAEAAEDAVIGGLVERALAPWARGLSAATLDMMRDVLTDMLETHPVATRLVGELKARPVADASGTVSKGDADASDVDPEKAGGERT